MFLDDREGVLVQKDVLVVEDVVEIEGFGGEDFGFFQILGGAVEVFVLGIGNENEIELLHFGHAEKALQVLRQNLGLGFDVQRFDYRDLAILQLARKDAKERSLLHLFVHLLGIIASFYRTMRLSATRPQRRTDGAVAGAAGAFLPPGLFASAANLGTVFGVRPWAAAIGELGFHDLLYEHGVPGSVKDALRKFNRTGHFFFEIVYVGLHLLEVKVLISKSVPRCPGTAPLNIKRLFSLSTETTSRFFIEILSFPMCPAIFLPGTTR